MPTTPTLTFGRVVAPPVDHRDIPTDLNTAWDDLGPRRPAFVVLHRMQGSLAGTDTYFRTEARNRARTDYGLHHQTGAIWRWTDPLGRAAPWASGPWTNPPGDGRALVAARGIDAINRDGISIEISGDEEDPVADVALARLARLIAFWADWCGVPHDRWPTNPATGLTFLYWHCEFNGGKDCPGAVVKAATPALIARVRAELRAAQVGGGTTPSPALPATRSGGAGSASPPPSAALTIPAGVAPGVLAGWFGHVAGAGGTVWTWDAGGPVSQHWLARGRRLGVWPALVAVTADAQGRLFRFADGWVVRVTAAGELVDVQDQDAPAPAMAPATTTEAALASPTAAPAAPATTKETE